MSGPVDSSALEGVVWKVGDYDVFEAPKDPIRYDYITKLMQVSANKLLKILMRLRCVRKKVVLKPYPTSG